MSQPGRGNEIVIALRHVADNEVGKPEDYWKAIEDEYSTRYCEMMGVAPTPQNKALVKNSMPLKDCELQASWASRSSAVADSISILPPTRKVVSTNFETGRGEAAKAALGSEFIDTAPPATAAPTTREMPEDFAEPLSEVEQIGAERARKPDARAKIPTEGLEASLVREFDRIKQARTAAAHGKGTRGTADVDEQEEDRRRRTKEQERSLQRKFILPFACERQSKEGRSRLISWHAPVLAGDMAGEIPEQLRAEVMKPIKMPMSRFASITKAIVEDELPYESLSTSLRPGRGGERRLQAEKRQRQLVEALTDDVVVRLAGQLAHFVYWHVFGALHHNRQLPAKDRHALLLAIYDAWATIEKSWKSSPFGVSVVLPCTLLTVKAVSERCFQYEFNKLAEDEVLWRGLLDRMNVCCMHLFDQDCRYARFGAFDGDDRALRLSKQLNAAMITEKKANPVVAAVARASPLVQQSMTGDAIDAQTRVLLEHRSNAENPIADEWAAGMDEKSRLKLFSVAQRRVDRRPAGRLPLDMHRSRAKSVQFQGTRK